MDADGANPAQLTTLTEKDIYNVDPVWTQDGAIAFIQASRGIEDRYFTLSSDGANLREITKDQYAGYYKEWSPDKTAYVVGADGARDITVFSADGAASVPLLEDKAIDREPTWCP